MPSGLNMIHDVIIVGAGIAGLSCAQELTRLGCKPVVIDKGRGVGGRCATRRVDGQPVDHGVAFLHGSAPDFLEALAGVEGATRIEGWPLRVHGQGAPCQPSAFEPTESRLAFAEGVSLFPKQMARGLEVRLETRVAGARLEGAAVRLTLDRSADEDGAGPTEDLCARTVLIALPIEQAAALLDTLAAPPAGPGGPIPESGPGDPGRPADALRTTRRLLAMVGTQPCLTVLAGYPVDGPEPPWDLCYPESSKTLLLLSHDSAKRRAPGHRVMVYQAHARWSRERLDAPPELWMPEILEEAGRLAGPWAATPAWMQAHRWRYARIDRASELGGPLLAALPGGARLGLAGELFAPGGGIEAAWQSGRRLAKMVMQEGSA